MPTTATVEPATSSPATTDNPTPTVAYDLIRHVISATVVVYKLLGQTKPSIVAVPFTIPAGDWSVQWNLITGVGVQSAIFPLPPLDGIIVPKDQKPPVPKNVKIGASTRNSDTQWQIQITNAVTTVNSFNYDVCVDVTGSSSNGELTTQQIIIHDPTIAVTQDPMTGTH